jgi:hypothetical protein
MHRDNVPIPAQSSWAFEEMRGQGKIVNFWFTAMPPVDFDLSGKIRPADLLRNLGTIRHLLAFDKFEGLLRNVWINIYFDDDPTPAVDAPLGDFFGVGFGEYKPYQSRYLMMTAGGYVCQFHMPFHKTARLVLVNKIHPRWRARASFTPAIGPRRPPRAASPT